MEFLKNIADINWTPANILKAVGLLLIALLGLSLLGNLFSSSTGLVGMKMGGGYGVNTTSVAPSYDGMADRDDSYAYSEEAAYGESGSVRLSTNNIGVPSPTPVPGATTGSDAEEYEISQYSASIEARDAIGACAQIAELKARESVIFENANEHDKGCNYTFKVQKDSVADVLAVIESLDPKQLTESTYTIKRQLDDFTSQTEILENKLASIDETLNNAIAAYDEITALATQTQNADSLAKVIDSKINTIERLTQQRISITAQLERLAKGKADQLDRLEYTYFDVHVYENKFIDGEYLKDSWKSAVKGAVRDINRAFQDMTVNLIAFLFIVLQWLLYLFILLFLAKFVWHATKAIWQK